MQRALANGAVRHCPRPAARASPGGPVHRNRCLASGALAAAADRGGVARLPRVGRHPGPGAAYTRGAPARQASRRRSWQAVRRCSPQRPGPRPDAAPASWAAPEAGPPPDRPRADRRPPPPMRGGACRTPPSPLRSRSKGRPASWTPGGRRPRAEHPAPAPAAAAGRRSGTSRSASGRGNSPTPITRARRHWPASRARSSSASPSAPTGGSTSAAVSRRPAGPC